MSAIRQRIINVAVIAIVAITIHKVEANKFEPYTLNGGLVSAIAGKDFVIIASDTRLSDGGYNILSRNYLDSRLWVATDINVDVVKEDGSIIIPPEEASIIPANEEYIASKRDKVAQIQGKDLFSTSSCPTLVASSGCSSDCEALKRQIKSELGAHQSWNNGSTLAVSGVANLLGQTLYSRRSFPFYSFCICAGLESHGHGHIYVYDAIGSHERVAVASTGNGKEMLQPILDRMFANTSTLQTSNAHSELQRDGKAVKASDQRLGLKLETPVETHVSCDEKEALAILVRGYRSVAEREISIGDNVVACILSRPKSGECFETKVMRFPLKKH
jgi:20S proteasome subunit beta 6